MRLPPLYRLLNKPKLNAKINVENRFFYVDNVPQNPPIPYIVWSIPGGINPSLYLACKSNSDRYNVQIDVYANNSIICGEIAGIIRDLLFIHADENYFGFDYEKETGLSRAILDVSLFVNNLE